jgi:hypothetical protein
VHDDHVRHKLRASSPTLRGSERCAAVNAARQPTLRGSERCAAAVDEVVSSPP